MKTKFMFYISILMMVGLNFSCKDQDLAKKATIRYGTSFGMCAGYCIKDLVVNNKQATLSLRKHGSNPELKSCTKEIADSTLSAINKSIDVNTFNTLPDIIGCPDCADGGAEYVEITSNGKTKKVTFEYGKTPTQLKALVDQIKPIFVALGDCK